ncbi:hypothetical protein BDR03DRAFT_1018571, partial [Suillus americanus]
MLEHELSSSQTESSIQRGETTKLHNPYNSEVIERCLKFIIDFRKHKIPKGTAVLGIQQKLASVSNESDPIYSEVFAHYLEVLNSILKKVQPKMDGGGQGSSCVDEHIDSKIPLSGSTKQKQRGRAFSKEAE